jgi:hypothetical protein
VIYIRVGVEIFQKRSQLRAAGYENKSNQYATGTMNSVHDHGLEANPTSAPFYAIRTTEIEVSTDPWTKEALKSPATAYARSGTTNMNEKPKPTGPRDQYSVTISSANGASPPTPKSQGFRASNMMPRRPSSMDKIKWAYTKCALLFAISILITWVPASVNRVYGYVYPPLFLTPPLNRNN